MQKVFFLFLCIFLSQKIFAQKSLPIIRATSTAVDIRVGDEYFAKSGWVLEPAKKPDVFSIGSKWWYNTKKVTFITNIDSISFNVQPAHKYDFVILLNATTPCYMQITTIANPIFMNLNMAIPVLAGVGMISMVCYFNRRKIKTKMLLQCGYVAPILFWLMTFISGYIHSNYNHLTNTISELGAIGTASECFTSFALVFIAFFCIFFSIGFYRVSKAKQFSVVPSIFSFSMPVSMIWASIFTLGNEFHGLGGPLTLLIILGSLLSYILWTNSLELSKLRKISLLGFFITTLILLKFINPLNHEYEGLVQRFFYLGWTIWTIAISFYFLKSQNHLQIQSNE